MHRNIKNDRFLAKMSIFGHFSINVLWPQIDPKSDCFKELDANKQMSNSWGQNETFNSF